MGEGEGEKGKRRERDRMCDAVVWSLDDRSGE